MPSIIAGRLERADVGRSMSSPDADYSTYQDSERGNAACSREKPLHVTAMHVKREGKASYFGQCIHLWPLTDSQSGQGLLKGESRVQASNQFDLTKHGYGGQFQLCKH